MVLDEVWRHLDGVEALSGPHGGPLRRTVKLILDPLVIRPVQNPLCAGAVLTEDGAVLLATRVNAASDVLRATAAWFTLLKQTRRALRITEGNAQDQYFQRCFELATRSGMPDATRDRAAAEAALREIHDLTAGRTTQALREYLTDPARERDLAALIATAWGRRPHTPATRHAAQLALLLDACAAERLGEDPADIDLDDLVAALAGTHTGIAFWLDENTGAAQELGLTLHPQPRPPMVGTSAATATLGLPFDRTIHERVFTVLQASSERADLPEIPELVAAEIARACAPWALLDESLRVAAAAGAVLAQELRPIAGLPAARTGLEVVHEIAGTAATMAGTGVRAPSAGASGAADGARRTDAVERMGTDGCERPGVDARERADTAAARVINGRWQREAYVLQARRLAVRTDPAATTGPLAAIAADLQVPWRPYLRRLWARLHGWDVREFPLYSAGELWDVLDGVARSVILDHRTRVKRALATSVNEPEAMESRAG
ncbi:hypothetical protein LTV02_19275 [Nocardia yamanashiensis]|uniref:hypothetical protein n=1 Tax=Nocardia yamanashiensis TaxID=209247 RepID=UPI001E62FA72|nr:hypothetical protein [Nocardia yamanashiensis]UGT45742.1 hypothetical protein LTV02_19275 [Nocardia yamanashiensis]